MSATADTDAKAKGLPDELLDLHNSLGGARHLAGTIDPLFMAEVSKHELHAVAGTLELAVGQVVDIQRPDLQEPRVLL